MCQYLFTLNETFNNPSNIFLLLLSFLAVVTSMCVCVRVCLCALPHRQLTNFMDGFQNCESRFSTCNRLTTKYIECVSCWLNLEDNAIDRIDKAPNRI